MPDLIADTTLVNQKIKRLSYEIYERHYATETVHLIGLNERGNQLAQYLETTLNDICELNIVRHSLTLNPQKPNGAPITDIDFKSLNGKSLIIVDDVANTGRTMFYACRPFLDIIPDSLEFAVLVDRKHKTFPVHVDYVGLSLATTLKENIRVKFTEDTKQITLH